MKNSNQKSSLFLSILTAFMFSFFIGAATESVGVMYGCMAVTFIMAFAMPALGLYLPSGCLNACVLTGISNPCTGDGNTAGINKLWAINKDSVTAITVDVDGAIDSITLAVGKVWASYEFEENVATFSQPITVNGSNTSVKQIVSIVFGKMDTDKRNEIMNLIECGICGMHMIVRDNNDKYWYLGISYNVVAAEYSDKAMKTVTSAGHETGADSEADQHLITLQFEGKNKELAREWTLGEAGIDVTP